jgi:pilus assembly protein CpaC
MSEATVDRQTNAPTVEFKKFGVGLAFTPVVLSEGRISMKINTEVSELSSEGAIVISGTTIPGLRVRSAESTVELPSGGSLVMAGLISEESKQALNGLPGLKNIPILGALFRSRDFIKQETELVVIVTPFIVDPVARSKLARPDENFLLPNDKEGYLGGKFNKITRPAAICCDEGGMKDGGGFIIE